MPRNGGSHSGPVEADETYLGSKRKNMPKAKREKVEGRGIVDKTIANSVNNTKITRVKVCSLEPTNKDILQGFIQDRVKDWGRV